VPEWLEANYRVFAFDMSDACTARRINQPQDYWEFMMRWAHECNDASPLPVNSVVSDSVLGPEVRLAEGARVDACVLMRGVSVHRDCSLIKTVVEEGAIIPAGLSVGVDPVQDKRLFHVTPDGVVWITRAMFGYA
jgi:NDP-sugar pyrophosphorylase family protein